MKHSERIRMRAGISQGKIMRITLKKGAVLYAKVKRSARVERKAIVWLELLGITVELPIDTTRNLTLESVPIPLNNLAAIERIEDEHLDANGQLRADVEVCTNRKALTSSVMRLPHWETKVVRAQGKRLKSAWTQADDLETKDTIATNVLRGGHASLLTQMLQEGWKPKAHHVQTTARANRPTLLAMLLEHDAPSIGDPDTQDKLVFSLAQSGYSGVLKLFLNIGFNPNAFITTTHNTQHSALLSATRSGYAQTVRVLLEHGADLLPSHFDLLDAAIKSEDETILDMLIAHGVDLDCTRSSGSRLLSPLYLAGSRHQKQMLRTMIAQGAKVDTIYPDGSTLLCQAARLDNYFFAEELLKTGADPNAGWLDGCNPLALARKHDRKYLIEWLTEAGGVERHDQEGVDAANAAEATREAERIANLPSYITNIDPKLPARAPFYHIHANALGVKRSVGKITIARGQGIDALRSASDVPLGMGIQHAGSKGTLVSENLRERFGFGADGIALVRAKLEHLFGAPNGNGDAYKISFEYHAVVTFGDHRVDMAIYDWKAREMVVSFALPGHTIDTITVADAAFWALVDSAPFADFKARFIFDAWARVRYGCDNGKPWSDMPGL